MTDRKDDPDSIFDQYDWPDMTQNADAAPPVPPAGGADNLLVIEEPARGPKQPKQRVVLAREDVYNGEFFRWAFGDDVRYDHIERRWYIWHKGSHHWHEDKNEHIKVLAVNAAKRRIKEMVNKGSKEEVRVATSLMGLAPLNRALDALRFQTGIGVEDDHWNMDPELFCVANGVLNLRTAVFREGDRLDNITKASKVHYDTTAECPKWERFLREVFVTDELIDYVQTVVGYCMTGLTIEQVWFLLYGTGGNGKSVFVSVLQAIFGVKQYFESAAAETFIASRWGQSGSHNVAQLKGARLVVASEVPERSSFDGARIKALTGDGTVTAAAKYQNNATWVPQLKLMMLVNHLPSTHDDTFGFWRRIKTIPFEVTFDADKQNPNLLDELLTELPGILNWCFDGAVTWFQSGLAPEPSNAVTLRTEYRAESDPLALFVHECVVETKVASDTMAAREVYRIYTGWSASQGVPAMTETNFGRAALMKGLGLGKKVVESGTVYVGIKVYESGGHQAVGIKRTTVDD